MYLENSEIKFIYAKGRNSETNEIETSYIKVFDGMECIGLSNSMNGALTLVDNYMSEYNYVNEVDWEKIPIDTKVLVSDDGET